MGKTIIITFMGTDRPGLVSELAACVADHGGNWVESRLVHLGGQFAGVLRVELPSADSENLIGALRGLEAGGLTSISRVEEETAHGDAVTRMVRMEILGSDRPGILKAISLTLAGHKVNIEELSTERRAAPMSGGMLFQARALVLLPPGVSLKTLRADLEKIAGDLMVDLLLGEATS